MKRFLAAGVLLCAGVHGPAAHADGRYQMLAVPDTTGFGGEKIVILDAVGGHVWTWSEHAATPGGPGGRFLIYQGQVRPGGKMGDIIQNEEWRGKRRLRTAAREGIGRPWAPPGRTALPSAHYSRSTNRSCAASTPTPTKWPSSR